MSVTVLLDYVALKKKHYITNENIVGSKNSSSLELPFASISENLALGFKRRFISQYHVPDICL